MGKAIVYDHLGGGLYNILYKRENAKATARAAELETLKTALDEQMTDGDVGLVAAKTAAQTVYNNSSTAFESALNDWAICAMQMPPCADQADLMDSVKQHGRERAEAAVALNTIKSAISINRAEYYSATQEIAFLASTAKVGIDGVLMQSYCVDYDPGDIIPPSTEVGTVETYGAKGGYAGGWLPRAHINIQTSANPDYSAARDHCIQPVGNQTTATLFYNWAQWLYVMANNPQHAVGTVLSKFSPTQDYLDVVLYGDTPTAFQPVNYPFDGTNSVTLLNVPVEYLSCGAELFDDGDRVVVRFSDINRSTPTVIGFAENPVACGGCLDAFSWPWHGLATEGEIELPNATTHTMSYLPSNGAAWLIDKGGADLPLTEEAIENGWQWRNYAFISGGTYYGQVIEENSFIYLDSMGVCWLVALTYSYPTTSTLRVTATINKYRLSGISEDSVVKTVDIACAQIAPGVYGVIDYTYQTSKLEDVWTNGYKAIIGTWLTSGGTPDITVLFSAVEITLSGDGGSDGYGITLTGTESKTNLNERIYDNGAYITGCNEGVPGEPMGGLDGYLMLSIFAKYAYYNSSGGVCVARLKYRKQVSGGCGWQTQVEGYYLLENDTEIDKLEHTTNLILLIGDITETGTFYGSLADHYQGNYDHLIPESTVDLYEKWRTISDGFRASIELVTYRPEPNEFLWVQQIDHKSMAFYYRDVLYADYGPVRTPLGNKTAPTVYSFSTMHFAWQRKTGEFEFSTSPICYV